MRHLSEIVSRRASEAIRTAQESARSSGSKLSENDIAKRMAVIMDAKPKSVLRQLRRYLACESAWRVDYIEALAGAVGVAPNDLTAYTDDAAVPEATRSQFLLSQVSTGLDPEQMKRLATLLVKAIQMPNRYALIADVAQTIVETDDQPICVAEVSRILLAPGAFAPEERLDKASKPRRQRRAK